MRYAVRSKIENKAKVYMIVLMRQMLTNDSFCFRNKLHKIYQLICSYLYANYL